MFLLKCDVISERGGLDTEKKPARLKVKRRMAQDECAVCYTGKSACGAVSAFFFPPSKNGYPQTESSVWK